MGLSSQLYQIKYLAPPEQLKIDFIDSDTEEEIIYNKPNINNVKFKPINEIIQSHHVQQQTQQIQPFKMVPTANDLMCAIKSLKKVINKDD
jgi:hypothetical protein